MPFEDWPINMLLLSFHVISALASRLGQSISISPPLFCTNTVQLPVVTQTATTKTNSKLVIDSAWLHNVERLGQNCIII